MVDYVCKWEEGDDEKEASVKWRLWLRRFFGKLVDRDSAGLIIEYGFIVCQWCEEMEGMRQVPWHLTPESHLLPYVRLCPDDFDDPEVLICRSCSERCEADTILPQIMRCLTCKLLVGAECCMQITWCQSNDCICRACTILGWEKLVCSKCENYTPATHFYDICEGARICGDDHDLVCDNCQQQI